MSAIKSVPSESISSAEIGQSAISLKYHHMQFGDKHIVKKMADDIVQKKIVWAACNKKQKKYSEEMITPLISCFPINIVENTLPKKPSLSFKSEEPIVIGNRIDMQIDDNDIVLNNIIENSFEDANSLITLSMTIPVFPIAMKIGGKSISDNVGINHMVTFLGENISSNTPSIQGNSDNLTPEKQFKYATLTSEPALKNKLVIKENSLPERSTKGSSKNKLRAQSDNVFFRHKGDLNLLVKNDGQLIKNDSFNKLSLNELSNNEQRVDVLNKSSSLSLGNESIFTVGTKIETKNNEFHLNALVDALERKSSSLIDNQLISSVEVATKSASSEEPKMQFLQETERVEINELPESIVVESITDAVIRSPSLSQTKEPAQRNYKLVELAEPFATLGGETEKKPTTRSLTYAFNRWKNEPSVTFELATKSELIASTDSHEVQHALDENKYLLSGELNVYIQGEKNRDEQRNQQQQQQQEED